MGNRLLSVEHAAHPQCSTLLSKDVELGTASEGIDIEKSLLS